MAVQFNFCMQLVVITFRQQTLGQTETYLQFMDKVAWVSLEKQGNDLKYCLLEFNQNVK